MNSTPICLVEILLVIYVADNIKAITVKPCPTNKIAPHRRISSNNNARTFGHIFSLFVPDDVQGNYPGGLQEEPQADDPEDCGEIEDYDENDLSSVTQKKQGQANKRFFNGPFSFIHGHYKKPKTTTIRAEKNTYSPTRPPPGGYFGTNPYRPQMQLSPSAHLKPVQEYNHEPQMLYRPGLVGVPLGHVVGMHQLKPARHSSSITTQNKEYHKVHPTSQSHRHPKARNVNDNGILRSFIDLLL
ncbi:uncharacterized protein LOC119837060 [Zerene cesonia]|uniref:uncharacterized protein LOC119837060 n=1 Tax=Zerene cesonia TaxID=33412 RepID=UPI0018E56A22|nr:uncharacterized protein LOC119837060 [Zerene cesonia]